MQFLERDITKLIKDIENLPVDNENKDIFEAEKNNLLGKVEMRKIQFKNNQLDNEIKKLKEIPKSDNITEDIINDMENKVEEELAKDANEAIINALDREEPEVELSNLPESNLNYPNANLRN
jgi:hypothetical protein